VLERLHDLHADACISASMGHVGTFCTTTLALLRIAHRGHFCTNELQACLYTHTQRATSMQWVMRGGCCAFAGCPTRLVWFLFCPIDLNHPCCHIHVDGCARRKVTCVLPPFPRDPHVRGTGGWVPSRENDSSRSEQVKQCMDLEHFIH
jgi:hypothetical protein